MHRWPQYLQHWRVACHSISVFWYIIQFRTWNSMADLDTLALLGSVILNQSSEALKHVWKTWIRGQMTGDKLCTLSRLLHAPMLLEPSLAVWKWNQAQVGSSWVYDESRGCRSASELWEKIKDIKIQQMKLQAALHAAFVEKRNHRMCCIGKNNITGQLYAILMCALLIIASLG